MSKSSPYIAQSIELAVAVGSAQFSTSMAEPDIYEYVSTTDSWIAQGANPTASAASGSMFVPAKTVVTIRPVDGAKLAAIRDTADGKASLTPVRFVR